MSTWLAVAHGCSAVDRVCIDDARCQSVPGISRGGDGTREAQLGPMSEEASGWSQATPLRAAHGSPTSLTPVVAPRAQVSCPSMDRRERARGWHGGGGPRYGPLLGEPGKGTGSAVAGRGRRGRCGARAGFSGRHGARREDRASEGAARWGQGGRGAQLCDWCWGENALSPAKEDPSMALGPIAVSFTGTRWRTIAPLRGSRPRRTVRLAGHRPRTSPAAARSAKRCTREYRARAG